MPAYVPQTSLACKLVTLFPLNVDRLWNTLTGTPVMTNRSFEFQGGTTVYPAGSYLVLLPGHPAAIFH